MRGFWERFEGGSLGVGWRVLLSLGALIVALLLIAFVFRPLVDALSRRDSKKIRDGRVRRISFSLLMSVLTLPLFTFLYSTLGRGRHEVFIFEVVELFLIVFSLYAGFEIVLTFFADFLPQWRGRLPAAPIYKDIFRTIVFFGVFLWGFKQAFPTVPLGTLLTTSAILSVVLGLALQDSLSNIFAGLTLSVDRPFKPGDWLLVDGQEGKVLDSNWRSTRLVNRDNDVLNVPNNVLAKSNFINFAQPEGLHLCRRRVGVEYAAHPNKVRAILIETMHHVEGVLRDPPPDLFTLEYGETAATYEMRFWIRDFDRRTRIESDVMRGAWYHLQRNNIRIAFPTREVFIRRDPTHAGLEETLALLGKVELLRPLGEEDRRMLAEDLLPQLFAKEEVVCRQGERGSSFYIIKSGVVSVRLKTPEGVESEISRLRAGDYFGEMSLLTGEPRNSTCLALEDCELLCLDRDSFAVLLAENPPIAKSMSEILYRRQQDTLEKLSQSREMFARKVPQSPEAETRRILEKIWSLFGFRR